MSGFQIFSVFCFPYITFVEPTNHVHFTKTPPWAAMQASNFGDLNCVPLTLSQLTVSNSMSTASVQMGVLLVREHQLLSATLLIGPPGFVDTVDVDSHGLGNASIASARLDPRYDEIDALNHLILFICRSCRNFLTGITYVQPERKFEPAPIGYWPAPARARCPRTPPARTEPEPANYRPESIHSAKCQRMFLRGLET